MLTLIMFFNFWIEPNQSVNAPAISLDGANSALEKTLNTYVDEGGRVDYQSIRENPFALQPFLDFVANVSPISHPELFPTRNDKKAYWINVYNGLMIKTVIENPHISSVKEIDWGYGVFWCKKFKVGGEMMTLNHIEHKILRGHFKDTRIHFAINCGSNSCPPLGQRILTGEKLDQQLERKTRDFINDPENVGIDPAAGTLCLSRIFKWYKTDFESGGTTLLEYIKHYLDEKVNLSTYKIKFQDYDWDLNDQKR